MSMFARSAILGGSTTSREATSVNRELGDGLVLRTSTPADAEAMAAFVGDVLRAQDSDEPNRHLAAWTRDLHQGRHPSFRPAGCRARRATVEDAPFLTEAYATASARSLVSVPRDAAAWRYELAGRSADNAQRREIHVLERDGHPVGYVAHALELFSSGSLVVTQLELTPGVSWREAWLAALAPLFEAGDTLAAATPNG